MVIAFVMIPIYLISIFNFRNDELDIVIFRFTFMDIFSFLLSFNINYLKIKKCCINQKVAFFSIYR